jgi:phage gp46-like protein
MAQVSNPCAPLPGDPCRTVYQQPFKTGVSFRHVPACDGSHCDLYGCGGPNMRVTNQGTLDRSHWLEGWISHQLLTRGEVSCDEHPLKKRDGGWWFDSFRQPAGQFRTGSKLWSLNWNRVTNESLMLAKQYANQSLQYLVAWGIASSVKIETTYVSSVVMRLHVSVSGPGVSTGVTVQGQAMPNAGWIWEEYKPGMRMAA